MAGDFTSPLDILRKMVAETPESTRKEVCKYMARADDMTLYHPTLGRRIRNTFHLWDEANPYTRTRDAEIRNGVVIDPLHPDNLSGRILEAYWLCIVKGKSPEEAAQDKDLI